MSIATSPSVTERAPRVPTALVRTLALTTTLAIAVLGLTVGFAGGSASAATQDLVQCNGLQNVGGQELDCDIDIVNTLNLTTGTESSTVTTRICSGAAASVTCTDPVTTSYNLLTTSVNQCNGSVNGGGAILRCNVTILNTITGAPANSGTTPGTVNQCNGSGAGGGTPTLFCDPFPASVSGATITQCNGSVNGGGAPNRVECTALSATTSALLPVTINQCNDSANGGGSLAVCRASLTTNVTTVAAVSTPTPVATAPAKNVLNASKTDGFDSTAGSEFGDLGGTAFLGAGVLILLAAGLLTAARAARKTDARR